MTDFGTARDSLGIMAGTGFSETGIHHTTFQVEKWDVDQIDWTRKRASWDRIFNPADEPDQFWFNEYHVPPFETYIHEGNQFVLDTGWVMMMNGIAGSAVTKFSATVGRIGLGTSATAVTHADTALNAIGALTVHNWELVSGAPTVGGTGAAGIIFSATFPTGDANNVAIQEFGVDAGTAAALTVTPTAVFFEHGNATPGTKTSAQTWNATVTITWA
jgi:hypothetical protein